MNLKHVPLWLVGLLIGVGLIALTSMDQQRGALTSVFERAPTPELVLFDDLLATAPVGVTPTPHAETQRLSVYVTNMQRVGSTLEIRGTLENRSSSSLMFGLQHILFIDAANTQYSVGDASVELLPNIPEPFVFQVPVPPGRPVTMTITLDPDPAIVVPLLQESITP